MIFRETHNKDLKIYYFCLCEKKLFLIGVFSEKKTYKI